MTNREVDEKVASGSLEVLDRFSRTIAVRDEKTAGIYEISLANPELLPQLNGQADEVREVSKPLQKISATYKSFSESWHFPSLGSRSMPQLDGEGEGSEKEVGIIGKFADLTIHQSSKKTSLTYKKFSESWHFPKIMPQLDGEGGEGHDDAGDSDATIHDLDEQADLSVNLDDEELNMEAEDLVKSREGVKIQVGF